jgi:phosphohistidine phosphatase
MAAHMRRAKVRPELVLCSSATRAVQTYELIAAALGPSTGVLVEDDLYGASDTDLLIRLQGVPDEVGATLLVGHNPGLQDLALGLAGDGDPAVVARLGDKFPTCALASLEIPAAWEALGPGCAVLTALVSPRELPN